VTFYIIVYINVTANNFVVNANHRLTSVNVNSDLTVRHVTDTNVTVKDVVVNIDIAVKDTVTDTNITVKYIVVNIDITVKDTVTDSNITINNVMTDAYLTVNNVVTMQILQ
jgi:hypothetical protein